MVRNASPGTCLLATVYLHWAGLIWLHRKRGNRRHDRANPIVDPVVQVIVIPWHGWYGITDLSYVDVYCGDSVLIIARFSMYYSEL